MGIVDLLPEDSEYYDSPEQLLEESDIVEMDVRIIGWNRKFRIRALNFGQMERINRLSIRKPDANNTDNQSSELDQLEWTYLTIAEGVVRPRFTTVQARKLVEKNGEFVTELANQIWTIGRISKATYDAYVDEQKKLNEARKQLQKAK